jgi:hypothetical protein
MRHNRLRLRSAGLSRSLTTRSGTRVRVDGNGRVVAKRLVFDDGWSRRGTFAGDAEGFIAAKSDGVGLKPDPEEPPPGTAYPAADDPG